MPHGSLKIINNTGMPKGSNKFYAKDKIAIAKNLMETLDPGKFYIGEYIADAQRFVEEKGIMPGDQSDGGAVAHIAPGKNKQHSRIYYDGMAESIDEKTFVDESIYNFLPDRFKTYKPNG